MTNPYRADEITAHVIANVKLARKARRLTAHQLAAKIEGESPAVGLTRSKLANLEAGRREYISVAELAALALALNVEPWSLTIKAPPVCIACNNTPLAGYRCLTCNTDGVLTEEGTAA